MTPSLVLTILAVTDLPRMRAFYRDGLGWPLAQDIPVYAELLMPNGQRLGLYDAAAFARNTGLAPGFRPAGPGTAHVELYLRCEDVDAAGARLHGAGAALLSPRALRDWGDEAAYYADPEGNVVVLARTRSLAPSP